MNLAAVHCYIIAVLHIAAADARTILDTCRIQLAALCSLTVNRQAVSDAGYGNTGFFCIFCIVSDNGQRTAVTQNELDISADGNAVGIISAVCEVDVGIQHIPTVVAVIAPREIRIIDCRSRGAGLIRAVLIDIRNTRHRCRSLSQINASRRLRRDCLRVRFRGIAAHRESRRHDAREHIEQHGKGQQKTESLFRPFAFRVIHGFPPEK